MNKDEVPEYALLIVGVALIFVSIPFGMMMMPEVSITLVCAGILTILAAATYVRFKAYKGR